MNLLFLCVGNCVRSQMGEAIAKRILANAPGNHLVQSAGMMPAGYVHPLVTEVLKEIRIDASGLESKSLDDIDTSAVDRVISFDQRVPCPVFLRDQVEFELWEFDDPTQGPGSSEEHFEALQELRDEIHSRVMEIKRSLR